MKYPLIFYKVFFSPVEFILQGSMVNSEKFQGRILSFSKEEFLAEQSLNIKFIKIFQVMERDMLPDYL